MRPGKASTALAMTGLMVSSMLFVGIQGASASESSPPGSGSFTLDVTSEELGSGQSSDPQTSALIDSLVAGVDQASYTWDQRAVPASSLATAEAKSFEEEFVFQGGSVINLQGDVLSPNATSGIANRSALAAAASSSTGRAWSDVWGLHMTLPRDTLDRLSTLAATGSAAAGAVAALLAANIEGFPVSTTGAFAAGAVALGLILSAGVIQACNINGNGAQVNFNWIAWTCWPL